MCQAFEGEQRYLIKREVAEIREAYEKHLSGEKKLTDKELQDLAVRQIMLMG